ncbi:hypothetical protein L2E82_10843 [Cichorium intybus]|uniref:Uncharacterized protein n=1 Tax=Cichorium intybus TaxID=13427 RepID=A0ACB9GCN8_CICIN|nr:hypothetical protein L2E82_10843 [Cichorium intybus]
MRAKVRVRLEARQMPPKLHGMLSSLQLRSSRTIWKQRDVLIGFHPMVLGDSTVLEEDEAIGDFDHTEDEESKFHPSSRSRWPSIGLLKATDPPFPVRFSVIICNSGCL